MYVQLLMQLHEFSSLGLTDDPQTKVALQITLACPYLHTQDVVLKDEQCNFEY